MKRIRVVIVGLTILFSANSISYAEQTIVAQKVDISPVIDGTGTDLVWGKAQPIVTHDNVADIDITMKAVYTDNDIFFLVNFPDPDESRRHKDWVWDKDEELYFQGPSREDTFVFKWSIRTGLKQLILNSDEPYVADIWFWKACRTDISGYADDKIQTLNSVKTKKSKEVISKSGKTMYLIRAGDQGTPAYKSILFADYRGDTVGQFEKQISEGSRGDIKAKGIWSGGKWTVEFTRALDTKNNDDVQFDISKTYLFGVSRYEISGRLPDPKIEQPFYGAGDVSETLMLQFGE